ncbi:11356_t:CDS:2, partial [Cetraspora pellucida]
NVINTQGMTIKVPDLEYKHTRTLKDYLGNNAQTLVISCVPPALNQIKETINTLEYATQARNHKNTSIVHHEVGWHNLEHLQDLVLKLRTEKQYAQDSQTTRDLNGIMINHNDQKDKDIDELEEKLSHLQRSYAKLSQDLPVNSLD